MLSRRCCEVDKHRAGWIQVGYINLVNDLAIWRFSPTNKLMGPAEAACVDSLPLEMLLLHRELWAWLE